MERCRRSPVAAKAGRARRMTRDPADHCFPLGDFREQFCDVGLRGDSGRTISGPHDSTCPIDVPSTEMVHSRPVPDTGHVR
jgi:hypothetical protein